MDEVRRHEERNRNTSGKVDELRRGEEQTELDIVELQGGEEAKLCSRQDRSDENRQESVTVEVSPITQQIGDGMGVRNIESRQEKELVESQQVL